MRSSMWSGRRQLDRRLGSELHREVLRLAVPAFVTLVAEPIFLLADSVIVGHLGTIQLAALGVAAAALADRSPASSSSWPTAPRAPSPAGSARPTIAAPSPSASTGCGWPSCSAWPPASTLLAARARTGRAGSAPTGRCTTSATDLPADQRALGAGHPAQLRLHRRPARPAGHPHPARRRPGRLPGQHRPQPHPGVRRAPGHRRLGPRAPRSPSSAWPPRSSAVVVRLARRDGASLRAHPTRVLGAAREGFPLLLRTLSLRGVLLTTTWVAAGLGVVSLAAYQVSSTIWTHADLRPRRAGDRRSGADRSLPRCRRHRRRPSSDPADAVVGRRRRGRPRPRGAGACTTSCRSPSPPTRACGPPWPARSSWSRSGSRCPAGSSSWTAC